MAERWFYILRQTKPSYESFILLNRELILFSMCAYDLAIKRKYIFFGMIENRWGSKCITINKDKLKEKLKRKRKKKEKENVSACLRSRCGFVQFSLFFFKFLANNLLRKIMRLLRQFPDRAYGFCFLQFYFLNVSLFKTI